jgi:hypothetical protein
MAISADSDEDGSDLRFRLEAVGTRQRLLRGRLDIFLWALALVEEGGPFEPHDEQGVG